MQKVCHSEGYSNVHPILDDIERFYSYVSDRGWDIARSLIPITLDSSLLELRDLFDYYGGVDILEEDFGELGYRTLDCEFDDNTIIVCFSGGKDSFAVAKHYKELGYNVILYHIKGLNYTQCGKSSEHFGAQEVADHLELPLYIDNVSYNGYHKWIEHPMKNWIMMGMALNYGIKNKLTTKIAVGNFQSSYLDDNAFDVCGGDCVDMLECYSNIIGKYIPSFELLYPNENYETSFNALLDDREAIPLVNSCITSNKYKLQFRERTQKLGNVKLLPRRCGCCWKCALEYVWFVDHDVFEMNEDYYIRCVNSLWTAYHKENGVRLRSLDTLWSAYFFYPISESKLWERLQYAVVYSGKIKFIS